MVWSRGGGDPAVFETVAGFAQATGQEQRHLDLVGRRGVTGALRVTPAVRRGRPTASRSRSPRTWPGRSVARPGVRHLGAWVD